MPAGRSGRGNQDDNMDATEKLISKVCANFSKQLESKLDDRFEKFEKKLSEMSDSMKALSTKISNNSDSISIIEDKFEIFEQATKRNTLRFLGFEEHEDEDVVDVVINLVNNKLKVSCNPCDIDSAFRVGKRQNDHGKSRAIMVNFVQNIKRNEVFNAKKQLKNTVFAIFEDLTPRRYELLLAAKKKYGKNLVWSSGGKIYLWNESQSKRQLLNVNSPL